MSILPLVLIFVVMYFLVIRPQSKKAKEHQNMISGLKKGDRVVMSGGLIGTVLKVTEGELELSVAHNTNVFVAKQMVSALLSTDVPTETTVIEKPKKKK
ncbi:MAG: preprotein translocase subunit YajC [Alphaproteobacteria bacterium]